VFFALVNVKELLLSFPSVSLAFSCLTILTTTWGQSAVFSWLIKTIGLSALITWTSIGVISIRFREAYKAQGYSLSDLPYQQPFYPWLPVGVIVLGVLMCIASSYPSVIQRPIDFKVSTVF
jgi:amino acid permease